MTVASVDPQVAHDRSGLRFSRLRILMFLCLFDLAAPLLVLLQVFDLNLVQLVPMMQPIIFLLVLMTMQRLSRAAVIPIGILALLIIISLIKSFALAGAGEYNFVPRAMITYFYSLAMPCLIVSVILSQRESDPDVIFCELIWFSRWFFFLSIPIILFYFSMHITGRFNYFGFGINFHYFAPFLFYKNMYIAAIAVLILLSGKRSVLVNFILQLGLFFSAALRRRPVHVLVFILFATLVAILAGDKLSFLLRRFYLMGEVLAEVDWSGGLFGIADTHSSIVLFGGRLEEVTGVMRYFEQHTHQIWFGAPPGANYLWKIEWSDLFLYKSFTHMTWVSYVFRFGVIPSVFLFIFLIYLLFRSPDTKSGLWLVYAGILSSATFGANLLGSPTAWILIAMYFRYGRMIART